MASQRLQEFCHEHGWEIRRGYNLDGDGSSFTVVLYFEPSEDEVEVIGNSIADVDQKAEYVMKGIMEEYDRAWIEAYENV